MLHHYHGTDAWRLRSAISNVIADTRARHPNAAVMRLDAGLEEDLTELERILKYRSFLGHSNVIVLANIMASVATSAATLAILELYGNSDDIIIAFHSGSSSKPTGATASLEKFLRSNADKIERFEPLSGAQLRAWICQFCRERGRTITPNAVRILAQCVGSDSWALAQEMEKLCAHAMDGVIDERTVRLLVHEQFENNAFELANAIARHDKRGAIAALWRRAHDGTPEYLLVGAVAGSIRTLLVVGDLASRQMPATAIAQTTGIHQYVVVKTLRTVGLHNPNRLREAHANLTALDQNGKSGTADVVDGLFSIVLTL